MSGDIFVKPEMAGVLLSSVRLIRSVLGWQNRG
jgi:hypothetical protein